MFNAPGDAVSEWLGPRTGSLVVNGAAGIAQVLRCATLGRCETIETSPKVAASRL